MHEVIELHIVCGRYRLRIRRSGKRYFFGHVFVQVESLVRDWNHYLGATCGLAQVSASGKALNIELFDAGNFTISLSTLKGVMYGNMRKGVVARIPNQPMQPVGNPAGIPWGSRISVRWYEMGAIPLAALPFSLRNGQILQFF